MVAGSRRLGGIRTMTAVLQSLPPKLLRKLVLRQVPVVGEELGISKFDGLVPIDHVKRLF